VVTGRIIRFSGKKNKNNEIPAWIIDFNNPILYGRILLPILQKDWR